MNDDKGERERRETGTPPRRAPALGSRFRENDDGGGRVGGGCWWREALRQARANGIAVSACDGVWGIRRCDGAGGGGAPPLAPLDTGFRRYDGGDVRANKCCWLWRGEGPAAAGRALREAPLRRDVASGMRRGLVVGALRQAQGERIRGARLRRGGGQGCGVGVRRGVGVRAALWRGLLFWQGDPAGAEELGVVFPAAGDFSYLVSEDGAFREG